MALPLFGSCRADDEAYDPYFVRIRDRLSVCVDGRPVRDVIAFDCRDGWVRAICYRRPVQGQSFVDVQHGVATERLLRGHVTVFGG